MIPTDLLRTSLMGLMSAHGDECGLHKVSCWPTKYTSKAHLIYSHDLWFKKDHTIPAHIKKIKKYVQKRV